MRRIGRAALFNLADKIVGRGIVDAFARLKSHDAFGAEEMAAYQLQALQDILVHAGAQVPYYRDLFRSVGFNPAGIKGIDGLKQLPLLDKEILRARLPDLLAEGAGPLIERRTGGSTGPRVKLYYDAQALDITAAAHMMAMEQCGKKNGEPEIHFASRTLNVVPWRDRVKEYAKSIALNRRTIFVDLFAPDRYERILAAIKSMRPKLVQGYPSIVFALACYCEKQAMPVHGLFPVFESEGETVSDLQREKIERVFGAKVFNRYGNAEFGVIAHECHLHDGLHVRSDLFVAETVPVEDGVGGLEEIVVTGLTNRGMPLIRYRTGDLGSVDNAPCRCGSPFPRLKKLQGRVHDLIRLEGLGYLSTAVLLNCIERVGGVLNFQVMQMPDGIRLCVVPDADYSLERIFALQKMVWKNHGFSHSRIDIDIVERLNLSPQGKFRYVAPFSEGSGELTVIRDDRMGRIAVRASSGTNCSG